MKVDCRLEKYPLVEVFAAGSQSIVQWLREKVGAEELTLSIILTDEGTVAVMAKVEDTDNIVVFLTEDLADYTDMGNGIFVTSPADLKVTLRRALDAAVKDELSKERR